MMPRQPSTRFLLPGLAASLLVLTLAGAPQAQGHVTRLTAQEEAVLKAARGPKKEILSDPRLLQEAGVEEIVHVDPSTNVAFARITPLEERRLSEKAHEWGRCGGFEAVNSRRENLRTAFQSLRQIERKNFAMSMTNFRFARRMDKNRVIEAAVNEVNDGNLKDIVTWLSNFPTRYNKGPKPNEHVAALKERLDRLVQGARFPVRVDVIDHTSTPQKTLRVRIEGAQRPNEIVVLGGHLDSIAGWGGGSRAPGADDNASGSANLIEALRILLKQPQPERSIEFMWYAGEESGLLGSAEIARTYKQEKRDVIGVLQLDMTLFPGSGEFVLGSMTDFTSAWLRQYFTELNSMYIRARIVEDRCGYGCSDHASWHRQGYPALMPFEATFRDSNPRIHTPNDVIDGKSNFRHSAMFSKIAVAFAMDLGNSSLRSP